MDQSLTRSRNERLTWSLIVLFSLPLVTLVLWFNYAAVVLLDQKRRLYRRQKTFKPRQSLLITGVSTPYGLDVARAFYKNGYRVLAAETYGSFLTSTARRSRAISSHFQLPQISAVQDVSCVAKSIVKIIESKDVSLWIDCSEDLPFEVISYARRSLSNRSNFLAIGIDEESYGCFKSSRSFLNFLREHELPAREMYQVKSRREIHNVLNTAQGKKQYLLKSSNTQQTRPLARLPRRSLSQTYQEVSLVKISDTSSLVLEETIDSNTRFRAFAVAVRGKLSLFQVRRLGKAEDLVLDDASALCQAFKACVSVIVEQLGAQFSCHLNVLFSLAEHVTKAGVVQQITIIDGACRPDRKASFPRNPVGAERLTRGYTNMRTKHADGDCEQPLQFVPVQSNVVSTAHRSGRYALPDSITALFFEHDRGRFRSPFDLRGFFASALSLLWSILFREEEWYDFEDPLPAFWEYAVRRIYT